MFLTKSDEQTLKNHYLYYKTKGDIDKDIIHALDKLNEIEGLATLYSCQGHRHKGDSYLVFMCNEELSYFVSEAIYKLNTMFKISIEWDVTIHYKLSNGTFTKFNTIILRGTDRSCAYINGFASLMSDNFFK